MNAMGIAGAVLACGAGCFSSAPRGHVPDHPVVVPVRSPDVQAGPARSSALPIVILVFRDHTITVYAGETEPRYTIATSDGHVLAIELSAAELKDRHPDIYETYESSIAGSGVSLDASLGDPESSFAPR